MPNKSAGRITFKGLMESYEKFKEDSGKPYYPDWLGPFFARVWFVRVLWSVRNRDRAKYWRIVRQDWKEITGPWIRHRKMWRKYMAGYSKARAPE